MSASFEFKHHDIVAADVREAITDQVIYEKKPARNFDGSVVAGLYNAWITLNNPTQFNSYTTDMVKSVILAFRAASNARDVNAVVFTGAGDRAFCTGGNTPRSTPNTMPAIRRNIASTCGSSTIWCRPFSAATSR